MPPWSRVISRRSSPGKNATAKLLSVVELVIGGPASPTAAPGDAVQIAGANGVVRVAGRDGALYAKRGSTWPQTATDVLILATQQGSPR